MDWKQPSDSDLMDYIRQKYLQEMKELHSSSGEPLMEKYFEPFELKPGEFFEYMEAKGISDTCSACGSDSVIIPVGAYTEVVEPESSDGDVDGDEPEQKRVKYASFTFLVSATNAPTPLRPYYIRHCANCGHLDLFRAKNVLEWVKEYRKQKAEDNNNVPD